MIEIIKNKPSGDDNEDMYFSFYDDLKLPKDGKPFSVESSFYSNIFYFVEYLNFIKNG